MPLTRAAAHATHVCESLSRRLLLLLDLSGGGRAQLDQGDDDDDQEKDNCLGLADALPLGSAPCIEGIINIECKELRLLGRLTACQGQVLVEHLEAVGQGQEGADRDRRHDHGDLDLEQDLGGSRSVDLRGLDQVSGNIVEACDVDDHHISDLLPAEQDDHAPEAVEGGQGQQRLSPLGQQAVQERLPDIAKDDAADQVGHEKDRAEDVSPLQSPGQRQRDGKSQDIDQNTGQEGEQNRQGADRFDR